VQGKAELGCVRWCGSHGMQGVRVQIPSAPPGTTHLTSIPWRLLPAGELGCGSLATVWRRLDERAPAGVFDALHLQVLDRLGIAGQLDWSRASVDTMSVRAKRGGPCGANPVDRGKPGSKLHLITDGQGLPLAVALTAANVNDSVVFEGLLDDVPAVRMPSGRRRCRPGTVHADRGTTSGTAAPSCADAESKPASPGEGSSRRSGWDASVGG
jgi:hypothetical protein